MNVQIKNKEPELKVLDNYLNNIPNQIWSILVPSNQKDQDKFRSALKVLRIKEKERNYVLELQVKYSVPIRPNETVKETMTRIRIDIMRKRAKRFGPFSKLRHSVLPSDPLE